MRIAMVWQWAQLVNAVARVAFLGVDAGLRTSRVRPVCNLNSSHVFRSLSRSGHARTDIQGYVGEERASWDERTRDWNSLEEKERAEDRRQDIISG